MAKTFTAPFAQTAKTASAVATGASAVATDAPTNTVLLYTAGAEGALVTKLTAVPRATVTATALYLWVSKDGGTTKRLVDSELMGAYTLAATTAVPETKFANISETTPIRLEADDELYIGAGVALASGIVFNMEAMEY